MSPNQLAADFCKTIEDAAQKSGRPFVCGLTSGCTPFKNYPKIPWAPFVAFADIFFPQTYWSFYDDQKAAIPQFEAAWKAAG